MSSRLLALKKYTQPIKRGLYNLCDMHPVAVIFGGYVRSLYGIDVADRINQNRIIQRNPPNFIVSGTTKIGTMTIYAIGGTCLVMALPVLTISALMLGGYDTFVNWNKIESESDQKKVSKI